MISAQLNGDVAAGGACVLPAEPAADLSGSTGSRFDYANPVATSSDDVVHEQVGKTHAAIIRAAFQCDLIRVATHQWSPGTNHVSFPAGFNPDQPNIIFQHHPVSHRINTRNDVITALPANAETAGYVQFLANVQTWYNTRTAEILLDFQNTTDAFGGNLFDQTVFPYITEVAETTHSRSPVPALIFGGSALGMQHGQFMNFENGTRPHSDLWMTVAQAYLRTTDPLSVLTDAPFLRNGVSPIPGLWSPPA